MYELYCPIKLGLGTDTIDLEAHITNLENYKATVSYAYYYVVHDNAIVAFENGFICPS